MHHTQAVEHFWGLPVPVDASPVVVNLSGGKCIHLTQIALKSPAKSTVTLSVSTGHLGNRKFVLATLTPKTRQITVDATFMEGDEKVTFYASGSSGAALDLTGMLVSEKSAGQNGVSHSAPVGTAALLGDDSEDDVDDEDFEPNEQGDSMSDESDDDEDEDEEEDEDEDEEEDEDEDEEEDKDEEEEEDEVPEPEPAKKKPEVGRTLHLTLDT